MKKVFLKSMLLLCALIVGSSSVWATDYVKVTNSNDLVADGVYVIAEISDNNTKYLVTGYGSKLSSTTSGFSVSDNTISTTTASPLEFTLGTVTSGDNTYYTLKYSSNDYLGYSGSSTNFETATSTSNTKEQWSITPSASAYRILNVSSSTRYIGRNGSNIGPYSTSNSYANCYLFKKQASVDPSAPSVNAEDVAVAYNVTSGNIEYTIDNEPESAGTLTAAVKAGTTNTISNLAFGSITSSAVPFTCNANDSYIDRKVTVTLTYTYDTDKTVTKDVVITQGSNYGNSTNPYTVAQAIAVVDAAGKTTVSDKYVTGIVSQVDSYNSTYKSITYWISDDGTTTDQFEVYGGLSFNGGTAFSSKDDIQVGDVVVVKGNITYYAKSSIYEFESNNNLISQKLVAPTFYPAAGAVGSGSALTISNLHTDASIFYTTDGSTPTSSSTQYNSSSKPTITAATTFKAIAVKTTQNANDNYVQSDVASASYTILASVATPKITLASGTYTSAQSTTITCDTEDATIYYTTNGSDPTTSSTAYTGAISISESMIIKAIAAKDGMANSTVAYAEYTINYPVINAANVNIAGAATGGSIAYTMENTVEGGELTASVPVGSWVTLGNVSASAVAFTCEVNPSETDSRSTTVTLTYTYDTDKTVTKNVTVTQAKYVAPIDPAVAGVGAFVKVTSDQDLTAGTYLIVYEGTQALAFDGSLSTLDASGNTIKVNIVDGKIECSATTAAATFEIRPSSGTIKNRSGKYIGNTSDSNSLTASDNELTNDFEIPTTNNSNNNVNIISSGGAYLRYNSSSNQERFRYFKSSTYSSQKAITLYKYDATETSFATITIAEACNDGNGNYYGTFFTNRAYVMHENLEGYAVTVNAGKLTLSASPYESGDVVPAQTPLLIYALEANVYKVLFTDDTGTAPAANDLKGTLTSNETTVGDDCLFYRLTMHNGTDLGFWWGAANGGAFAPGANKAYLAVPEDQTGYTTAPARFWIEDEENNATNLESFKVQDSCFKYIENGKLLIKRDGVTYDAMGRIVK